MKKLALLFFTLLLTLSVSAQEKKIFSGAIKHAGLTKEETVKVKVIQKERNAEIKTIKDKNLIKEVEIQKIKEIKQAFTAKIKATIGKDKLKAMNTYWKKK